MRCKVLIISVGLHHGAAETDTNECFISGCTGVQPNAVY